MAPDTFGLKEIFISILPSFPGSSPPGGIGMLTHPASNVSAAKVSAITNNNVSCLGFIGQITFFHR